MADFNKVILVGRLTRDPELRYTPSGVAVTDLGLAVNRQSKGADGNARKETLFVDVTVWRRQAENCAEYLKKGRQVLIDGYLVMDQWQTNDGQKRTKHKIVASNVQFLGGGGGGGDASGSGKGSEAPAEAFGGDDDDYPF